MPNIDISIFLVIFIVLSQTVEAFYMHKNSRGTTIQTIADHKKSSESIEGYYTEDSLVTTAKMSGKETLFPSFLNDEDLHNEVAHDDESPKVAPLLQKDDAADSTNDEDLLNEVDYINESPPVSPLVQKEDAVDSINNGRLVIEGDIILNSKEELLYFLNPGNPFVRSAISSRHRLWPNGVIPYTIADEYSESQRNLIIKAMEKFQDNTCLTFIPKTDDHDGYVNIFKGSGCSSNVGRVGSGRQIISLSNGCLGHGTILHELMHTAGFWHEQSRYDRDDYVDIAWDNIDAKRKHNFNKHSSGSTTILGQAYDYNSLMHYHSRAFAIDRTKPTIIPKDTEAKIGNRRDFSELDIEGLNLLYNCSSTPKNTTTTATSTTTTTTATTTTTTATTTVTTTSPDESCTNTFTKCREWADTGACENYTYFMMKYCKQSCNACDDKTCDDDNDKCEKWASQGHCTRTSNYMNKYCKKSCDQCD